jgi:hypothetical protein
MKAEAGSRKKRKASRKKFVLERTGQIETGGLREEFSQGDQRAIAGSFGDWGDWGDWDDWDDWDEFGGQGCLPSAVRLSRNLCRREAGYAESVRRTIASCRI